MVYVPRGGKIGDEFEMEKFDLEREARGSKEFTGEPPTAGLVKSKSGAGNLLVEDSFIMD